MLEMAKNGIHKQRERELIAKAVTLLLLTLMKQFKGCHVFQFENLCRNILDANGILLFLKILNQDLETGLSSRPEIKLFNLSEQCRLSNTELADEKRIEADLLLPASPTSNPEMDDKSQQPMQQQQQQAPPEPASGSSITAESEINHVVYGSIVNYLRILQKIVKGKEHRISQLIQLKSVLVLKRLLKCDDPMIQRYSLKLIKTQAPYMGRKFRIANMVIFSGFFLHLRPELNMDPSLTKESDLNDGEKSFVSKEALVQSL